MSEMIQGDALTVLRERFGDESVQCCITSPPYWGLRDYKVEGQLGLEKTPEEHVGKLVEVFREVRRVLKPNGTLWLNLGDCYATGAGKVGNAPGGGVVGERWKKMGPMTSLNRLPIHGLKPKDMIGLPWRVAFALQADGWYLRCDIIWSKPNPMPESIQDRPTKAHEYLFLLSKRERYYYDSDAIKEPAIYANEARYDPGTNGLGGADRKTGTTTRRFAKPTGWSAEPGAHTLLNGNYKPLPEGQSNIRDKRDKQRGHSRRHDGFNDRWDQMTKEQQCSNFRNKRSVWTIGTQSYAEAHFATFPEKLVEPCVLAGCPEGGLVLDPFAGSGTVLAVASQLGRTGVGIELNPDYVALASKRCAQTGLVL